MDNLKQTIINQQHTIKNLSNNVKILTDLVIGLNTSLNFLSMRVSLNEKESNNEHFKKNMAEIKKEIANINKA